LVAFGRALLLGQAIRGRGNTRSIPSWTRPDEGAAYEKRIVGRQSTLRVGIENVADRRYWSSAAFGTLFLGAPRTVKATLQVDF
jgi:iron complex outermembrane receptor protein